MLTRLQRFHGTTKSRRELYDGFVEISKFRSHSNGDRLLAYDKLFSHNMSCIDTLKRELSVCFENQLDGFL